ncbi:MAG: arylamine N-acetyltransferase family protein [Carbonactinosporaceae bacterium]
MTGEWEIERLDLEAYLHRIGCADDLAPTGEALTRLHRAHIAAIPFENLDIVLGDGVAVDLDSVQAKLVGSGRGGYCYEHGVLFAAALERLGYTVDRLLARIGGDQLRPRPRTHMALRVRRGDEEWLADVGFGAGLLEPLPWGDTGAHRQGGWTYQLSPTDDGAWQVRERHGQDWSVLYNVTPQPQHASDVVMANHFTATHPDSPFAGQLVVMSKHDDVRRRLLGRQLSTTRPDGTTEQRQLTDAELAAALRDEFGVPLTRPQVAALTASLRSEIAP